MDSAELNRVIAIRRGCEYEPGKCIARVCPGYHHRTVTHANGHFDDGPTNFLSPEWTTALLVELLAEEDDDRWVELGHDSSGWWAQGGTRDSKAGPAFSESGCPDIHHAVGRAWLAAMGEGA